MEIKEAIKIIKRLIITVELGYNSNPLSKEGEHTATKALTLAISALEKQEAIKSCTPPSDDWEQYADRLHDIAYRSGYEQGKRDAEQDRWVPVTERLPERGVDVLVIQLPNDWNGKKYKVSPAWRCNVEDENPLGEWALTGRLDFRSVIPIDKVLAWRPLPEPYREEDKS